MKKTVLILLFAMVGLSKSATINVSPGNSIQSAINSAQSGDTIQVASGTYSGDVTLNKSNLTVRGTNSPKIDGFVKLTSSNGTFDGFACGKSNLPNARAWAITEGDHNTIANCKVENVTNSTSDDAVAFQLSGSYNTLLKCVVRNTDDTDHYRIFGDHNTISGCESYDKKNSHYANGPHADVVQSWGGCSNALIENCWFAPGSANSQFGILDTNPGGNSSNAHDVTLRNNVIIGGEHFFLFIRNTRLYNNIWYRSAKNIGDLLFVDQNNYSGYELKNNVFYDCGTSAGNGFITGSINGNMSVANNYFSYGSGGTGQVSHATGSAAVNGGDPRWVSPGNDFHIQSGSVLVGKGVALNPAFLDRDGNQRAGSWDIGPYQGGNAQPPAPSDTFKKGDRIITLNEVNVRETPAGTLAGTQKADTTGTVAESPASPALFNGEIVQWWRVTFVTGPNGWVGEDNLALSTATPTPSPTATPTPAPTPSASPSPTPPGTQATYRVWLDKLCGWIKDNPAVPDR